VDAFTAQVDRLAVGLAASGGVQIAAATITPAIFAQSMSPFRPRAGGELASRRSRICSRSASPGTGIADPARARTSRAHQPGAQRVAGCGVSVSSREILAEAAEIDAREDELYGDRRGDELPEQLRTRESRHQPLREAKERLAGERDQKFEEPAEGERAVALELDPREFVTRPQGRRAWVREGRRALDAEREREGRAIAKDRTDRLFEACQRLEEELDTDRASHAAYDAWRGRGVAADGSRRMAPGMVKPHEPVLVPTGLMNTTDRSRPMRTHGFKPLQGYNAQLVVDEQQVVIAAELTCDSPDFGHLEPMVRAARRELRGVEVADPGGRACRRRLLASAPDRGGRQRRHPGARRSGLEPAPRPTAGLDGRAL
jgi:hypothetical protein